MNRHEGMTLTASPACTGPSRPRLASWVGALGRLFSSITFGVTLLVLLLVYASVVSAYPPLRGWMEVTEPQIFRHWVFVTLIVLFCITLTTATWTRILYLGLRDARALLGPAGWSRLAGRVNLMNIGVLTVHSGLLLLVGGSAWYFSQKIEGDVLLRCPRVEVLNLSGAGGERPLGAILAERGETWAQNIPFFGGVVMLRVEEVRGAGPRPVSEATVQVQVGAQTPQLVRLTADDPGPAQLNDRLGLRLVTFPPETKFYDVEHAALFVRKVGEGSSPLMFPLEGLPLHRERYTSDGAPLRDSVGREVASKRFWPHIPLPFGLSLPTGWFEPWRLPLEIDSPPLPFRIQVTGYVPYRAGMVRRAVPGGANDGPTLEYTLRLPQRTIREPLFALDPVGAMSREAALEFRWAADAAARDAMLAPLAGAHELTIEVRDPPVRRTVAVEAGQTIAVEGTCYELTIDSLTPEWELASPQLRGAVSPVANVRVACGEQHFTRSVIERFPDVSQDVDDHGERHASALLDENLSLRYRTSGGGQMMIVAGPGLEPELGIFFAEGGVSRIPLVEGQEVSFTSGVRFTLDRLLARGRSVWEPIIEPLEFRRPGMDRQFSAIRLRLSGRGSEGEWTQTEWCPFTHYAHMDWLPYYPVRGVSFQAPGDQGTWELVYSRVPHALDAALTARKLTVAKFPGQNNALTWRSDFVVSQAGGLPWEGMTETNVTQKVGRWTLFQSGADSDHWAYTVLGVGNRRGIWPMVLGCVLIPLGSLYAFYVKPAIRRRRQQRALADARARGRLPESAALPTPRASRLGVGS
jgi:hypothetical protein